MDGAGAVAELATPPGHILRKKAQYYIGGTKDLQGSQYPIQIIRSTNKTHMTTLQSVE
jgi:hypothetical protein